MKYNFGKTFLLGLGFFRVSLMWSVYNAFVPIFLSDRFFIAAGFSGLLSISSVTRDKSIQSDII